MSTRGTIYHSQAAGLHIYEELADDPPTVHIERQTPELTLNIELPADAISYLAQFHIAREEAKNKS